MDFGNKIALLRKDKKLSRDELGKAVGTSGAIIGRYERNEITPSVEVAAKIAEALEVSLDYLVGSAAAVVKDKKMLKRIEEIEGLPQEDKNGVLYALDNLLKAAKLKSL